MPAYELSLRDYLRVVRKRKFVVASSFIIFTGLAAFYASRKPVVYEAATTVKIAERKTIAGLLTEWVMYAPGNVMENQAMVIKGTPVITKAALRLGLITEDTLPSRIHQVVGSLQAGIQTKRIGGTNMIEIIARSSDPQKAVDIANTVAETYIEENLLERNKQARTARKFIEESLAAVESRLSLIEQKLKKFREDVGHIEIAGDVNKKLIDLEFQLGSLRQRYTEKHPRVMQLKEQIEEVEKQLKGLSGSELEYARLQREVEVNRRIYAMLTEKLEKVRITEAEKVPDASVLDPAVLPRAPVGLQLRLSLVLGAFLGLTVGTILVFVAENLDTSVGTIEDVEKVAQLPVLGVAPSIPYDKGKVAGFLRGFTRRLLPGGVSEEEHRHVCLISHHRPDSPMAEMFRSIKTNIKISPSLKTILVTSAGSQEGKTTVVTNLGLVSAQGGLKVLLASTDLRKPTIARAFGLDRTPGLGDILMGTANVEEALRNVSDMLLGKMEIEETLKHPGLERLWVLPSGTLPSNPVELLDTGEFSGLMQDLRKDFDLILLDSAPVLPVADASILSKRADGVVLCYEVGRTSRDALIRAKLQLESAKANILGIVLNHTEPETHLTGTYPYYYRYRYYGRKEEEDLSV